jgi:hypothetical protein
MQRIRFSLGVFLVVLFSSAIFIATANCSTDIPGSGTPKTDRRTLGEFKGIGLSIDNDYTVTIEAGQTEHTVTIVTDDNLVNSIKTEIVNGKLKITQSDIKATKGVEIKISIKKIDTLNIAGAGRVEVKNISGSSFKLQVSGKPDINVSGAVDAFTVLAAGEVNIQAKELKAKLVSIDIGDVGHADVFASESLTANASGASNIEYYGNPVKVSNSGKVTKK